MFLNQFFLAFVTPNSITVVSNNADVKIQGEALGILSSVNAFALVISPLCSGSLVGKHTTLPMWVGGTIMLIAAILGVAVFHRRLLTRS
jgi:MFS family permease